MHPQYLLWNVIFYLVLLITTLQRHHDDTSNPSPYGFHCVVTHPERVSEAFSHKRIVMVDDVSRNPLPVFITERGVSEADAVSRNLPIIITERGVSEVDAVSRNLPIFITERGISEADALSRNRITMVYTNEIKTHVLMPNNTQELHADACAQIRRSMDSADKLWKVLKPWFWVEFLSSKPVRG
ncbi:hypothetical protein C8R45DRAFT_1114837 [Mycena sanguinolenta]|nr:hypothetical protein C8R45DRAFT_1114837 [Mycena sanguinolenta]